MELDADVKGSYFKISTGETQSRSFLPTHPRLFQDGAVLHWSPDLDAYPLRQISIPDWFWKIIDVENEDEPLDMLASRRGSIYHVLQIHIMRLPRAVIRNGRTDTNADMSIMAMEGVLNDECQPWSGEVWAAANDEPNFKHEICLTENCHKEY